MLVVQEGGKLQQKPGRVDPRDLPPLLSIMQVYSRSWLVVQGCRTGNPLLILLPYTDKVSNLQIHSCTVKWISHAHKMFM